MGPTLFSTVRPKSRLRLAIVAFVTFAAAGVIWAVTSPLMSVPDEPAHTAKAAAVWRGQFQGRQSRLPTIPGEHSQGYTYIVDVPASYARTEAIPLCFRFRPDKTAECAPKPGVESNIESVGTTAGAYPPLYYVLVGWPTRLMSAAHGLYVMRIVSALLCALLLTIAALAVREVAPLWVTLITLLLVATPEVWFLSGSINPNGFEIAAAAAVWASALAVSVLARNKAPIPKSLLVALATTTVLLAASRPLSPLFATMIYLFVFGTSGRAAIRSLLRTRATLIALATGVLGILVSAIMVVQSPLDTVTQGAPVDSVQNLPARLALSTDKWFAQMVAVFGWLDVGPVVTAAWTWLVALALAGALALLFGSRRDAWLIAAATVIGAFGPVAIQYAVARRGGDLIWQGRYFLPIAIGVPFMIGIALRDSQGAARVAPRLVGVIAGLVVVAQLAAHLAAAHRYAVGRAGRLFYLADPRWSPPGGWVFWLTATAVFWVGWAAGTAAVTWRSAHQITKA